LGVPNESCPDVLWYGVTGGELNTADDDVLPDVAGTAADTGGSVELCEFVVVSRAWAEEVTQSRQSRYRKDNLFIGNPLLIFSNRRHQDPSAATAPFRESGEKLGRQNRS
jgi:hypothetical protein